MVLPIVVDRFQVLQKIRFKHKPSIYINIILNIVPYFSIIY